MTIYHYDGTFDGILSCIFNAYKTKDFPYLVTENEAQLTFDSQLVEIQTNKEFAYRVEKKLLNCKTKRAFVDVKYAIRSNDTLKSTIIFNYIRKCIDSEIDISLNYKDTTVLQLRELCSRISFEVHRFKGFIRFKECEGNFYYANYEPDNDITELLMPHFMQRYKNQAFIIHDVKRNILGLYDGNSKQIIKSDKPATIYLSLKEEEFQSLWKTYYKSVNIKERKNLTQRDNYMPRRYHKNLIELYDYD